MGFFFIIVPALPVRGGIFGQLQCALVHPSGRLCLAPVSHAKITDWRTLDAVIGVHSIHLVELVPPGLTWNGKHDALYWGLGGIFWGPHQIPCLWRLCLPPDIKQVLATATCRQDDRSMG